MCGRFNISDSKHVEQIADTVGLSLDGLPARYNIAPTENIPVLYHQDNSPAFAQMRWWLVPSWSSGPSSKYAMFNARAESLTKSHAYQKPFKQQRAIIPASSFIEWKSEAGGKQPYLIQLESGPMAFAGLWDYWTDGEQRIYSCSIITTEATEGFKQIHKRMPVMLRDDELGIWLDNTSLSNEIESLLKPRLIAPLSVVPIDKAVNRSVDRNKPEAVGRARMITG